MSIYTVFVIWYLLGVVGCVIASYADLKKGEDFDLGDLLGCTVLSFAGLIVLGFGVAHCVKELELQWPVLIKGKGSK